LHLFNYSIVIALFSIIDKKYAKLSLNRRNYGFNRSSKARSNMKIIPLSILQKSGLIHNFFANLGL